MAPDPLPAGQPGSSRRNHPQTRTHTTWPIRLSRSSKSFDSAAFNSTATLLHRGAPFYFSGANKKSSPVSQPASRPYGTVTGEAGRITAIDVIADPGRLRRLRLALLPE